MDKLILLVGPSGSGKTTIAKELEKEGYNIIHSYTTRPQRYEGEWGHTFIDKLVEKEDVITGYDSEGTQILKAYKGGKGEMIAFFNDYAKKEIYFATKSQYQNKGTSIYIVDTNGARQVKENVKDAEVITIFLMADEKERYWRLFTSRQKGTTEKRIKEDRKIFSKCKCDYVVDANRDIDQVTRDIMEIIEQF